jgi:hypothetical protein
MRSIKWRNRSTVGVWRSGINMNTCARTTAQPSRSTVTSLRCTCGVCVCVCVRQHGYLIRHWQGALPAALQHGLCDGQRQPVVGLDLRAARCTAVNMPAELVEHHHQRRRRTRAQVHPRLQLAAFRPMQQLRELGGNLLIYRRLRVQPAWT